MTRRRVGRKRGNVSDGEDCDSLRDKGKAVKFNAMRSSLPPHILDLFDNVALKKASPRSFRTSIINSLFERTENGRYRLMDKRPMFLEAKSLYEKRFGKEQDKGFPKSVIRGLYFNNSEAALQAAVDCGDVFVFTQDDGKEYYAFHQVSAGIERCGGERLQVCSSLVWVSLYKGPCWWAAFSDCVVGVLWRDLLFFPLAPEHVESCW